MIYADFTILQKGVHDIVNIIALKYEYECCHNVVGCLLTTFCGNIVATYLKLSRNMLQQQKCANFSQLSLSPNVVETLLQLHIVSWGVCVRLSAMTLKWNNIVNFQYIAIQLYMRYFAIGI